MDSYQLTNDASSYGTDPPLVFVNKETTRLDGSGVPAARFKRKFRGLLLMSSDQLVASAVRERWVPSPLDEGSESGSKKQFSIEHVGDSWSLKVRKDRWPEIDGQRVGWWYAYRKSGDYVQHLLRIGEIFRGSQKVGTIEAARTQLGTIKFRLKAMEETVRRETFQWTGIYPAPSQPLRCVSHSGSHLLKRGPKPSLSSTPPATSCAQSIHGTRRGVEIRCWWRRSRHSGHH